jgi:anti-sigma B factor antagonist
MNAFYISDEDTPADIERGEDLAVVVIGGEIDYAVSPQLREHINARIRDGARSIVLDLAAVTFIDSTAIGVLVGTVMRLHELGEGALAVVCGSENERVRRIFEIAGIDSLIALHRSRGDAFATLVTAH